MVVVKRRKGRRRRRQEGFGGRIICSAVWDCVGLWVGVGMVWVCVERYRGNCDMMMMMNV
jgi:hypothetical protein